MRSCATAVLERLAHVDAPFETEPYELPWAAEARFFIHTLDLNGDEAVLDFRTQISPDGLNWCDLDDESHLVDSVGLTSWSVASFGQWLRLRCLTTNQHTTATIRIYLVGKS